MTSWPSENHSSWFTDHIRTHCFYNILSCFQAGIEFTSTAGETNLWEGWEGENVRCLSLIALSVIDCSFHPHGGCGEYLWLSAWGMSTFAVRIISFIQRIWYSGFWQNLCLPGTFFLIRVPWTVWTNSLQTRDPPTQILVCRHRHYSISQGDPRKLGTLSESTWNSWSK